MTNHNTPEIEVSHNMEGVFIINNNARYLLNRNDYITYLLIV